MLPSSRQHGHCRPEPEVVSRALPLQVRAEGEAGSRHDRLALKAIGLLGCSATGKKAGGRLHDNLTPEKARRSFPTDSPGARLDMQAALEITARHCGRELDQYGQCVAAKPDSWQRDCHHLKMSIARCTSNHPVIRQIRQACAEPFEAFEECLRQNEAAVGNCAEQVRHFLQCAEQVQPRNPSATVQAQPLSAS